MDLKRLDGEQTVKANPQQVVIGTNRNARREELC